MNLNSTFQNISTIIHSTWPNNSSYASGFYFCRMKNSDSNKEIIGEYWREILGTWLVTNRHVLEINGLLADSLTFHYRKIENDRLVWIPLMLKKEELLQKVKYHPNKEVDVAIIDVHQKMRDYILRHADNEEIKKLTAYYPVSKENYPGENKIDVEVSDDALVIGYPRMFYDKVNLFPIVKSGIIASMWKGMFNEKPYFLIDAKLFPGSSGSIVISKPTGTVIENGKFYVANAKKFAFLGVFSGEPYQQNKEIELENMTIISKEGYNVGIVWYYWLVDEIIDNGVSPV